MIWQKTLYGGFFIVVLPSTLALWAVEAKSNVTMSLCGTPVLGWVLATLGLGLMATGMFELWHFGGGLPMNAFPPSKLVSQGTFRLLPHPIYTGFVGLCAGVSILAKSASGLWLITPCVALSCAGLVLGYERVDMRRRFGGSLTVLPADEDFAPSIVERVRFLLLVVIPWVALYEFTISLPLPATRFAFQLEGRMPIIPWTAPVYESIYVVVALAPWFAQTRKDLRQLMVSGWTAMAVVFPFYWLVPSSAPSHLLLGGGWAAQLLRFERAMDAPVAALPSFHVLWAVFVARLFRPRWAGWLFAGAIATSCVTTGMHYLSDVLLTLAIVPLFLAPQRVWARLVLIAEWFANSWREWRIGTVRIINHGFYAGTAAFVHLAIVLAVVGTGRAWEVLVIALSGLVGAAIWAQWVEGSTRLRRPFGFYGGLIGAGLACLFFRDRWTLLAANSLGAPWLQAIGRLRCLVNGCCHGSPSGSAIGIHVAHPMSRVTHLAQLSGVSIYPTQLYSILTNIGLGLLLARLWSLHCPLSVVCGIYGIGNGVSRFVEEAYRGEPQTPLGFGLRLYQWLAIGTVVTGATLTALSSNAAATLKFSANSLILPVAFAFIVAGAMGVDLPESNWPVARLT